MAVSTVLTVDTPEAGDERRVAMLKLRTAVPDTPNGEQPTKLGTETLATAHVF
jgi:hypothetical protein